MSATRSIQRNLRKGRLSQEGGQYVVTSVTSGRVPTFRDWDLARRVAPLLDTGPHWRRSRSLCWVLMPDHFHVLIEVGEGDSLSRVVNRLKSHTARASNVAGGGSGEVWQRGFHDRALRSEDDIAAISRYIVRNPVRA